MQNFITFFLFVLTACTNQGSPSAQATEDHLHSKIAPNYVWTKVLDSADWKKSYNFQMFTQADTIWTFHQDGNSFSTNGKNWTKSSLDNVINNLAFLDYVQFNNSMYGLGHFEGNIEKFNLKSEIYQTKDFKQWVTLSMKSNLPNRFFYHPFVFENKIWIIGGEDNNTQYADIWNSTDGINWIKQKDNLPFGKRSNSQVVNFKGNLYLLDNDVWMSSDGLTWVQLNNEIVKDVAIFGYSAIVFDDKIWLLGCNRNGQFSSQVLVSEDGKNWAGQTAPWSPRGAIASTVFKGKIYITGGKYGGMPNQPEFRYSNDVWTLERIKKTKS
jgi:hypothetical protein